MTTAPGPFRPSVALSAVLVLLAAGTALRGAGPVEQTSVPKEIAAPPHGRPSGLPRPSDGSVAAFEAVLFPFLNERRYVELGWERDGQVRDTGPFLNGKYYGTHPAVRVWYSPETIEWLKAGRVGPLPDGAMFVKEQYRAPAARHAGKTEEQLRESLQSWTVMVKDSRGSRDGWFWSNPAPDAEPEDNHAKNEHPISGFGHYCTRCHAATRSPEVDSPGDAANEFTFASLRNIAGFPGEPLLFRVDDSWLEEENADETADEPAVPNDAAALDRLGEWLAATRANLEAVAEADDADHGAHPRCTNPATCERPPRTANPAWLARFGALENAELCDCAHLPGVTHDWAPLAPAGSSATGDGGPAADWATSNQCMGCHAGITEPFGPTMFLPLGDRDDPSRAEYGADGKHQSPYGEWRWTPMGLAGRDPIFLAQLETELAVLRREFPAERAEPLARDLQDACLRCHGAMGRHAFHADGHDASEDQPRFGLAHHAATAAADAHIGLGEDRYGALARDGVSCLVCHRMVPREQPPGDDRGDLRHYLDTSTTGNATFGPPGEVYGPYEDDSLRAYVMHHATGLKPKKSDYLSDSRMCGTCHVVSLPSVDMPLASFSRTGAVGGEPGAQAPAVGAADGGGSRPELALRAQDGHAHEDPLAAADSTPSFRGFHHHVEQATYLEWLNSEFQTEFELPSGEANPLGRSCQQCHMSDTTDGTPDGPAARSRIAAVQDATYPDAENLAPHRELTIPVRDYRRHDFAGLNVFLLELTNQFDDVLGVRKTDFMTGSQRDLPDAIAGMVRTAESKTARIAVRTAAEEGTVIAEVRVENLAGHRFPTGVGFRRAFLEVSLVNAAGEALWVSGATDATGTLVDAAGDPLPTEFFEPGDDGAQRFQPHHAVIREPGQVQVYETLLKNHAGRFTTSFVHGCEVVKDNRLLPRGWSHDGPSPELDGRYLAATRPGPLAAADADFTAGDGADLTRYEIAVPDGVDPATCTVRARLFYQATPPYFLRNLFTVMNGPSDATPGPAVRRLHAMASNLDTTGTPIEHWKLPIVAAEARVE